jgi:hypothetical protein
MPKPSVIWAIKPCIRLISTSSRQNPKTLPYRDLRIGFLSIFHTLNEGWIAANQIESWMPEWMNQIGCAADLYPRRPHLASRR